MKTIFHMILALTMISFCNAQTNEINKNKSLPEGVTNEWLTGLRDESGNKIIREDTAVDAFQTRNFTGLNPGDQFGVSVASAGDVNGDGFSDIIIGAPYVESSGTDAGRAYIYFGGLNVNTIPDVILSGSEANDYFGISVASAGDVNGDGYSDVIVGEYGYNSSTGRAIIFFGGAIMNNVQDVVMTGENILDLFGNSVSSAGDVNGDGYSDVIIGASNYNSTKGRAYICFGGLSMNSTPDVIMTGQTAGDQFGVSVAGGDINNDGFSDVLIGANFYNENTGRAYLYYGSAVMNNIADVTFNGSSVNDDFGSSVAFAGDINGDSYNDIIIGAKGHNSSSGIVYLYMGSSNMDNTADITFNGTNPTGYFGFSVSGAGDINSDGYSDIMVGAPYDNNGRVFIYYGGINMDNISDISLSGENLYNYYGTSVAYAGDMNGDGFADVLAGSNAFNSFTGKVYLYMEGMSGTSFPNLVMNGQDTYNYFGCSVASAGDVNGDGYNDIIIGALGYNSLNGRAYIFFGGNNMDNYADIIITEPGSFDFGVSVSTAGDVNADGYSDVIVGAYGYASNTGRAYIYYGSSSMNNIADVILTGESTGNLFGFSVSTAGDVNGDGYSDVIVGANGRSSNTGRAYIFYGGSSMDNAVDVTLNGVHLSDNFGYSVSGGGDVNGDGYADVIVGAYGAGLVNIFYGGPTMDNNEDVTLNSESSNSFFGVSVSSAGDLNGDGYSDVIVGAYGINFNTGQAYIFYGGSLFDNSADVVMTGEAMGNYFGISVSSAGDVNGDGYSDAIVGATGYNSSTGRSYIFYGGTSMNNGADIILTGEGINNSFGVSGTSAGDLNNDGSSDLIVGASGYNTATGRSYIYSTPSPNVRPNLISVKDVPNDQGGFVKLKWLKSGLDIPVNGTITNYIVERSLPPGAAGFQWEQIGTVLPTQNNTYYYLTASTPFDPAITGNNTFYFRITAYTNTVTQLYRSNIMSGQGLDNLPPAAVQGFNAIAVSNNVRLTWYRNHEPDLYNYVLYRSTSPTINVNSEPVFASVTDSTYLDTSPLSGAYYYFIVAQDIHYNKSIVAVAQTPGITVNMTIFIEGFYNSATNVQVSDTIRAYLRNSTAPYAVVDSAAAIVSSNGNSSLLFANAPTGTYYIMIKHRNSIETWSKSGGENLIRGNTLSYNFSDALTKAFGSNMKQIDVSPVRYGIFSADVNQNGNINLTDIITVYNSAGIFATGYVVTDVNGDNIANLSDIVITYNNSAGFVNLIRP